MRNHEGPSFDKVIPVDSHDADLVRKIIESESALTTDDIDKHVDSIIQTLRSIKDRTNAKLQIESFIQDEILNLFVAELSKNDKEMRDFIFLENNNALVLELRRLYKTSSDSDLQKILEEKPVALNEAWLSYKSRRTKEQIQEKVSLPVLFDKAEYRSVVERVQQALVERLKARINQEEDLSDISPSSIDVVKKFITPDTPHVQVAENLDGQKSIIRSDRMINVVDLMSLEDLPRYEEALRRFLQLPHHELIVPYQHYDFERHHARVEFLEGLTNLDEVVEGHSEENLSAEDMLQVISDELEIAKILAQNKLVSQDFSPANIHIRRLNGKIRGIFLDPEGLYTLDDSRKNRMVNQTSLLTAMSGGNKSDFLPPEIDITIPTPVTTKEEVFQIGMSMKHVWSYLRSKIESYPIENQEEAQHVDTIKKRIRELIIRMTFFEKDKPNSENERPSLDQAKEEIAAIMAELRKLPPKNTVTRLQ